MEARAINTVEGGAKFSASFIGGILTGKAIDAVTVQLMGDVVNAESVDFKKSSFINNSTTEMLSSFGTGILIEGVGTGILLGLVLPRLSSADQFAFAVGTISSLNVLQTLAAGLWASVLPKSV